MATMIVKGPRVQQKPANLLPRMQSRTNVDVARTLFSNTLILDGPELQDWQITLQLLRFSLEPEENPVGGGSYHPQFPEENPVGGGNYHPQFPEDPYAGGEKRPSFPPDGGGGTTGGDAPILAMPEEPAGRGGRILAFPIERPGTEDEVDDIVVFPQEPIEDDRRPSHMALVWTFDGTNSNGVQQLVEVPSFPPEDLGGGTEGPVYHFDANGYYLGFEAQGIIASGVQGSGKSSLAALAIEQCAIEILFGGDGYQPEAPGGAGGDRTPTELPSSGQGDDSEELAKLLQAFESVPSYVGRFADGREVW
jgi:hypothetical protein